MIVTDKEADNRLRVQIKRNKKERKNLFLLSTFYFLLYLTLFGICLGVLNPWTMDGIQVANSDTNPVTICKEIEKEGRNARCNHWCGTGWASNRCRFS